jgi:hypothetical protein
MTVPTAVHRCESPRPEYLGAVPEAGSPEDLAAFLHSEAQKWKRVIEIASVKID